MFNVSKNRKKSFIEEERLVDPATDNETWKRFIPSDRSGYVYQLSDNIVIGVSREKRHLRKDKTQVIFYGISNRDQWSIQLMPAQVFALCLFNGRRSLGEAAKILSLVNGCNYKAANFKLRRFLEWMRFGERDYLQTVFSKLNPSDFYDFNFEDFCISAKEAVYSAHLDNPISLMLMPTDKCQTDCVYCYACRRPVKRENFLSIKRVHEIIDEAADLGVNSVNLDGGDMMCREEIVEIIEHFNKRDCFITASTKGYISKKMAKKLYNAGLDYIQVSLDGPTPEIADRLTQRKGFFNRMIETIYNLNGAGIVVRSNSIITSSTVDIVPSLVDFLMTLPLDNIKICPAFRSLYAKSDDIILNITQKDKLREYMEAAQEKYYGRGINWECSDDVLDMSQEEKNNLFYGRPLCSSARTQCIITPDGKVVTCEQSPQSDDFVVGDLTTQSLKEVWDSKKMKEFCYMSKKKFKNTPCYTCGDFEQCVQSRGHCYLDALKAYGSIFAPSPKCSKAVKPDKRWC